MEHDVTIEGYRIIEQSDFYGIIIKIDVDGEEYEDSIEIYKDDL